MSYEQNERFVSAHARALIAVALLLAGATVDLFALALHLMRLLELGPFSMNSAVAFGHRRVNVGLALIGLVGLAKLALYVATAAAFLVWQHRAYTNLRAFAPKTDFTPGWAVGNWFIPFANFVFPYQAVKELWIKSDPVVDFSADYANTGDGARSSAHVGVWWFFWIVANVAGQVYIRLASGMHGGNTDAASVSGVVTNALLIAAAALAAAVVWTIDQMQAEKSRLLGLDAWVPPPPPPADLGTTASDHMRDNSQI